MIWGFVVLIGVVVRMWQFARAEEQRRKERGEPHTFRDDALLLLSGLIVAGFFGFCGLYPPLQMIVTSPFLGPLFVVFVVVALTCGLSYLFNQEKRVKRTQHHHHFQ